MSRHDEIQAEREQLRADLKAIDLGEAQVIREIGQHRQSRMDRLRALDAEAAKLADDELAGDYVVTHGNLSQVGDDGLRVMRGVGSRVTLTAEDARLALEQHIIERAPTEPAPAPPEAPIEPAIVIDEAPEPQPETEPAPPEEQADEAEHPQPPAEAPATPEA